MGLNRLISLSKNSVLPDIKVESPNGSKIAKKSQSERENRKETYKNLVPNEDSQKEIHKILKSEKSANTKKSILWSTLRISNKNKNSANKGNTQIRYF